MQHRNGCGIVRRTLCLAMVGLLSFVMIGCASDPDPILGTSRSGAPATQPTAQARVNCKCGTWAGSKGAPTECKKILQERARQRQLDEQSQSPRTS